MGAAITGEMTIEDLLKAYPDTVGFLLERGLPCVVCGEPVWGTLADLARQKGWDEVGIRRLVSDINRAMSGKE
ncbi:MAG TPA: hypothetical protein VMS71_01870 [Candidatus Acidoferrum sp.]|nr:hypothetical protein [Candidatus Acidoferrum sp.]